MSDRRAMYHMSIKIGNRRGGRKSSVAAAAYRAGEILTDRHTGKRYDYTRKKEVAYSEILLPENAPQEFQNREELWNSVEEIEKQDNAQLYREFEMALPYELSRESKLAAAHEFFQNRVAEGMLVDWSFHDKKGNPHVHGIAPTRGLTPEGGWAPKRRQVYKLDADGERIPVIDKKTGQQKVGARGRKLWVRETIESNTWNDRENAERWRKEWADILNRYLERERSEKRVDHRSYIRQGVDLVPTKHEGYAARKIEERGGQSRIAEENRTIVWINETLRRALEKANDIKEKCIRFIGEIRKEIEVSEKRRRDFRTGEHDRRDPGDGVTGEIPGRIAAEGSLAVGAISAVSGGAGRRGRTQQEIESRERVAASRKQRAAQRERDFETIKHYLEGTTAKIRSLGRDVKKGEEADDRFGKYLERRAEGVRTDSGIDRDADTDGRWHGESNRRHCDENYGQRGAICGDGADREPEETYQRPRRRGR